MANTTPNMNLTLNVVGSTPNPTWSNNINADWSIIDTHNHSAGQGVNITPAGMNINADLSFNYNNIVAVRSWRMENNGSVLSTAGDINCGYFVNGNFYINNASGTAVQITNGAGLNFSSLGTIGGDYGQPGVTAAVTYNNTSGVYTFTSSAGIFGGLATGPIAIANVASGSQPITLNAPAAATSYTYTLPPAVPAAASVFASDTSGIGSFVPYNSSTVNSTLVLRDSSGNINANQVNAAIIAANSLIPPSGTEAITGNLTVSGATVSTGNITTLSNLQVNGNGNVSGNLQATGNIVSLQSLVSSGNSSFVGGILTNNGSGVNVKFATFSGNLNNGNLTSGTVPSGVIYSLSGTFTNGVSLIPIGQPTTNVNFQFASPSSAWSLLNNSGAGITYYILAIYV